MLDPLTIDHLSPFVNLELIIDHCIFVIVPHTPTVGFGDRQPSPNDGNGLCVNTIADLRAQRFAHTSLIIIDKSRAA